MGFFIDCHFLFEGQLLHLSLHIEVLLLEGSEWNRGLQKMEWQVEKLEHFRHILLLEFNRGAKAAEVVRNICAVYGDNAIEENTARKWFSCFKEDRFDISGTPCPGRPSEFDKNRLNTLIHNDLRQCTRELANVMNCGHSTIVRYLHSNCKVKNSSVWVPHAIGLSQNHKNQRVAICASLLARHRLAREHHRPFLSCIVTGDDKLCLYARIRKRKEWDVPISPLGTPFLASKAPLTIFRIQNFDM